MVQTLERAPGAGYADLIIGTGFGDEGKGLVADRRIATGVYDMGVRFNGGANAGHERGDVTLHQVPSSIGHVDYNLLAHGSLVDPELLLEEFAEVRNKLSIDITPDNFGISDTAHLVLPHHKLLDGVRESGSSAQGSTKKGISFAAADKYGRKGVRGEQLTWAPHKLKDMVINGIHLANSALEEHGKPTVQADYEWLKWIAAARKLMPFMVESIPLLQTQIKNGSNILLEGAQAIGLDMDYGIYPLNTSSHTGPGGAINGTGLNHHFLRDVVGVAKLPGTRVGGEGGPFPTRMLADEISEDLRGRPGDVDFEQGKTTKRDRDIGYPDLVIMRHAVEVAGITELALTKMDKLSYFPDTIKVAVAYVMNGERRLTMPNSALKLAACVPEYVEFKNWHEDISEVREFSDLPSEAQRLVTLIEEELKVPVTSVGVGPQRDQVIHRPKQSVSNESQLSTLAARQDDLQTEPV